MVSCINYFIINYNVIIMEIKYTINVMCLNHPETTPRQPHSWKKCLPRNQSLVPKRLGTAALTDVLTTYELQNSFILHTCSIYITATSLGSGNSKHQQDKTSVLPMSSCANYLTSLSLGFLTCKIWITIVTSCSGLNYVPPKFMSTENL